jgi:hypothetical protein
VAHWQEGNQVTVRVFPCTVKEPRRFRIGISSPLKKEGSRLVYENTYFDGPPVDRSQEERVQVKFNTPVTVYRMGRDLEKTGSQLYRGLGRYFADWKIEIGTPPLSRQSFVFDGKTYAVSEEQLSTGLSRRKCTMVAQRI